MRSRWLISCEHGGNTIPPVYAPYFTEARELLESHRGYDPGAFPLYQLLAQQLADFSYHSQTSRLLVELNRSLHHKNLFSTFSRELPAAIKKEIIARHYLPYRDLIETKIQEFFSSGVRVVHLSIHSFTPVLAGEVRKADVGLLYDPRREEEKLFCIAWKKSLKKHWPEARVRMNYPYKGKADGFTTYLRKRFPANYIGIEFELNQKYAGQEAVYKNVLDSLQELKEKYA